MSILTENAHEEILLESFPCPGKGSPVPVALVYPNTYPVGMANLGFQSVYGLLRRSGRVLVERFFIPPRFDPKEGLFSVETGTALREFSLFLFSISFETDYLRLVQAVSAAGIPLPARDRTRRHPLVIAGGVATMINPEPVAEFVDAFLLGDFEAMRPGFAGLVPQLADSTLARNRRLASLVEAVPDAYVPSLYKMRWNSRGRLEAIEPGPGSPFPVAPALMDRDADHPVPRTYVLTPDSAFPKAFLVEISRGCTRGCRFCAAGFVYRPPRPWSLGAMKGLLEACLGHTDRVGVVGLEVLGREDVEAFCEGLLKKGLRLSFSSLRADAVTDRFASILRASGIKTATIAPEAGTQRMRDVINKNLTEEEIVRAAVCLARAGIPNLKLYFMLGLPFEEDEDVEGIGRLVDAVRREVRPIGRARGRLGRISVSVSTFVPKAWTPFQWYRGIDARVMKQRRNILVRMISPLPNTVLKMDSLRQAQVQSILSRGDRRLAAVLERVAVCGHGLKRAVKEEGLWELGYWRGAGLEEVLPWDVVGHGVKKGYLQGEWKRAEAGETTAFCRPGRCSRCGACP